MEFHEDVEALERELVYVVVPEGEVLEDEFGTDPQANETELPALKANAVQSKLGDCTSLDELLHFLGHPLQAQKLNILDEQFSHRLVAHPDEEI